MADNTLKGTYTSILNCKHLRFSFSACLDIFRNMMGATGTLTSVEMQKAMGAGLYATAFAASLFIVSAFLPITVMYAAKWKGMRDKIAQGGENR